MQPLAARPSLVLLSALGVVPGSRHGLALGARDLLRPLHRLAVGRPLRALSRRVVGEHPALRFGPLLLAGQPPLLPLGELPGLFGVPLSLPVTIRHPPYLTGKPRRQTTHPRWRSSFGHPRADNNGEMPPQEILVCAKPSAARRVAGVLRSRGYAVETAGDGARAVERAERDNPAVVLIWSDLRGP